MAEIDRESVVRIVKEIDELLGMRQGFTIAYREWNEKINEELQSVLGEDLAAEFERKGPRQTPVNRQHRVHIYRQRLHAQRRFLLELIGDPDL